MPVEVSALRDLVDLLVNSMGLNVVDLSFIDWLLTLSEIPENLLTMGSSEVGLIPVLLQVLRNVENLKQKALILKVLENISSEISNHPYLLSDHLRLLDTLVNILKSGRDDIRHAACGVIWNLSCSTENISLLGSEKILESLTKVLREEEGQARFNACGALLNLSISPETHTSIATPKVGLLPAIIKVLQETNVDHSNKLAIANILIGLSYSHENEVLMSSRSSGLLPTLSRMLKTETGQLQLKISEICISLSHGIKCHEYLISEELGLIDTIVSIFKQFLTTPLPLSVKQPVTETNSNTSPASVVTTPTSKHTGGSFFVVSSMDPFASHQNNHQQQQQQLGDSDQQNGCPEEAASSPTEIIDNLCDILWNVSEQCSLASAQALLEKNLHGVLVDCLLKVGVNPRAWGSYTFPSKMTSVLMSLLRHPLPTDFYLRRWGNITEFIDILILMNEGKVESLCEHYKSVCTLLFVLGRNERWHESDLIATLTAPACLETLTTLLANAITRRENGGAKNINTKNNNGPVQLDYDLSTFPPRIIIRSLLVLSTLPGFDKKAALESRVLMGYLMTVLEAFLSLAKPAEYVGMNDLFDIEAIELTIDLLLQLSFVTRRSASLCKRYFPGDLNLDLLLQKCLNPPKFRLPLSRHAQRSASYLLRRLQIGYLQLLDDSLQSNFIVFQPKSPPSYKLVISYSTYDANITLIYSLAEHLRRQQLEIVLFELQNHPGLGKNETAENSKPSPLGGPASSSLGFGNSFSNSAFGQPVIHSAVEDSQGIIICVSSAYRQSASCRFEAMQAEEISRCRVAEGNGLGKGRFLMVYVVVDSNFMLNESTASQLKSAGSNLFPIPRSMTTAPIKGVHHPQVGNGHKSRKDWLDSLIGDSSWYPLWEDGHVVAASYQIAGLVAKEAPALSPSIVGSPTPCTPGASEGGVGLSPPSTGKAQSRRAASCISFSAPITISHTATTASALSTSATPNHNDMASDTAAGENGKKSLLVSVSVDSDGKSVSKSSESSSSEPRPLPVKGETLLHSLNVEHSFKTEESSTSPASSYASPSASSPSKDIANSGSSFVTVNEIMSSSKGGAEEIHSLSNTFVTLTPVSRGTRRADTSSDLLLEEIQSDLTAKSTLLRGSLSLGETKSSATTSSSAAEKVETATAPAIESAWRLLRDPNRLKDPDSCAKLLSDLGVFSPEELYECDLPIFQQISALFKPVPRKLFAKYIEAANGIRKDLLCEGNL